MDEISNSKSKKTMLFVIVIMGAFLVLVGVSYAYFVAFVTSDEQEIQSGVLELTYNTGKDILLEKATPTEKENAGIHQFSVENTGTLEATYYMYLDNITLQKDGKEAQSENLKWKLYEADENYTEQEELADGSFVDGSNTIEMNTNITIQPGEKQYYILKIWLQETGKLQNEDQGLEFSGQVIATTEKKAVNKNLVNLMKQEAVLDNIASTYVTSETGIDFSQISSDTNGKGLYTLHGTENNPNPIMYYRGAVQNNNVKFANFCWKIVRTTETGGVKLIYNGKPNASGECTATRSSTMLQYSTFNANSDDNAYVGYMYGTPGSSTYEETHANTNDSTIKGVIDTWYRENMTEYTNKLEDTVWCNDRSLDSSYDGTGTAKDYTEYGADYRLYDNKTPSLACENENDRFTVSEENGNGALTYPVALLTADEIAYAGAVYSKANSSYYLYNNGWWWSLSAYFFFGSSAHVFVVNSSGYIYSSDSIVDDTYGVRPAVSLKTGVMVTSVGDGTKENPYVVVE